MITYKKFKKNIMKKIKNKLIKILIYLFIILKNLKMTIKNQYFVFKDINVDNPFYKK